MGGTLKRAAVVASLLATTLASVPARAEVESKDPIKLTLHDWTGQFITTNIITVIIRHEKHCSSLWTV